MMKQVKAYVDGVETIASASGEWFLIDGKWRHLIITDNTVEAKMKSRGFLGKQNENMQ